MDRPDNASIRHEPQLNREAAQCATDARQLVRQSTMADNCAQCAAAGFPPHGSDSPVAFGPRPCGWPDNRPCAHGVPRDQFCPKCLDARSPVEARTPVKCELGGAAEQTVIAVARELVEARCAVALAPPPWPNEDHLRVLILALEPFVATADMDIYLRSEYEAMLTTLKTQQANPEAR